MIFTSTSIIPDGPIKLRDHTVSSSEKYVLFMDI